MLLFVYIVLNKLTLLCFSDIIKKGVDFDEKIET